MPEKPSLRYEVFTGEWVVVAPARASRPNDHARSEAGERPAGERAAGERPKMPCPFCPGNEHMTEREVLRVPDSGGDGWRVRVVPNKYAAVDRAMSPPPQSCNDPLFREMAGFGIHDVVIESPDHHTPLALQPRDQVETVLTVLRARIASLMNDPRLQAVSIFKNHGERAGTSLAHPHWQMVATPFVPSLLQVKHARAAEHFGRTSQCLHAAVLEAELRSGERVLTCNASYVAVLPFASQARYHVRILPRQAQTSFAQVGAGELSRLAETLQDALARLHALLGNPSFNLTLTSAPRGEEHRPFFRWHIDILPRLNPFGGFELGTGMSINTTLPEHAERELSAIPARPCVPAHDV
jgi:UDPglucose--hexose-1-phosphate uridylyltransferase